MSILVNRDTRLLVQGITGREGEFHSTAMLEYGTNIVAGVTPGKGGQAALDGRVPVFDTVADAVEQTGANANCIFVPAAFAPDAMLEARRGRGAARGVHHRGRPGARHAPRLRGAEGEGRPAHRTELPGPHERGRG